MRADRSQFPDDLTHCLGFYSSELIYIWRAQTSPRCEELTADPILLLHAGGCMCLHMVWLRGVIGGGGGA